MTPLDDDAITAALAGLPSWSRDGDALVHTRTLPDFRAAVAFIVRLSFEAERLHHHPELFNVYGTVRLRLTTHDAGDRITARDVALARAISAL